MTEAYDKFIDTFADYQMSIDDISDRVKPEAKDLYKMLISNPDERNPDILESFIDAEIERSVALDGDEEFADAMWSKVMDLAELSIDELMEFEEDERDEIWDLAVQTVSAVSIREALIRAEYYTELLLKAVQDGPEITGLARKAGVKNLEKGFDVKTRIGEKKRAIRNG